MAQSAPGFSNLKEGATLNERQENALPDISGFLNKSFVGIALIFEGTGSYDTHLLK